MSQSLPTTAPAADQPSRERRWPGVVLASVIALIAWQLGQWLPLIGGPVCGIVLGVLVRHAFPLPVTCQPGIRFAGTQILQGSIIALGLGLSLTQVAHVGSQSLAVTLVTISVAFLTAGWLGRWLGIPARLKVLIGVGTAICGGSAIAAVTPIVNADEHETAFAISTIFLFNLIAVLTFPLLGHLLHMSELGFGLWAGTAINDTSSVVAAGYSYGTAAGDYATIVKLTRATLIIPVCLGLALWAAWRRQRTDATGFALRRIFPWFILWFVVASCVRTLGWIPPTWHADIHRLAEFLMIVALAAIGLSSDLRHMRSTGWRPILLGLGTWIAVATSSLLVQAALHQL